MVGVEGTVAGPGALNDASALAMACVLDAERAARQRIDQARLEVEQLAEASRTAARAVAERTERRMRAVTRAFESATAEQVAGVDALAIMLGQPHALSPQESAALQGVVHALAHEMIGWRP